MKPARRVWRVGWILALFAGLAGTLPLRAELRFDETVITLKPAGTGDAKLTAEFAFTNTGPTPIAITEVYSGCLCTVPERPEKAIESGARGVIPVEFSTRGRQGTQRQTVQVKSSDGATHVLTLVAELPVRVAFAPRLLVFRGGETAPRAATVTYGDDLPVELLGVEVDGRRDIDGVDFRIIDQVAPVAVVAARAEFARKFCRQLRARAADGDQFAARRVAQGRCHALARDISASDQSPADLFFHLTSLCK